MKCETAQPFWMLHCGEMCFGVDLPGCWMPQPLCLPVGARGTGTELIRSRRMKENFHLSNFEKIQSGDYTKVWKKTGVVILPALGTG